MISKRVTRSWCWRHGKVDLELGFGPKSTRTWTWRLLRGRQDSPRQVLPWRWSANGNSPVLRIRQECVTIGGSLARPRIGSFCRVGQFEFHMVSDIGYAGYWLHAYSPRAIVGHGVGGYRRRICHPRDAVKGNPAIPDCPALPAIRTSPRRLTAGRLWGRNLTTHSRRPA